MTEKERRNFQRIPFIADVLLRHNDLQRNCELEDISLKGMLIKSPQDIEPQLDDIYSIDLQLGEGVNISLQAKITHTEEGRWGLEWEHIDLDGFTHLRRLLELNTEDPDEIHRELNCITTHGT